MAKKKKSTGKKKNRVPTSWLSIIVIVALVGLTSYLFWTAKDVPAPTPVSRIMNVEERARTLVHENPEAEIFESSQTTQQRLKQVISQRPNAEVFESDAHPHLSVEAKAQQLAQENPDAEAFNSENISTQKKTLAPSE